MVNCGTNEMKTCVYGTGTYDPTCGYICKTGHMRDCPASKCKYYQKIDKEHPRIIDKEADWSESNTR